MKLSRKSDYALRALMSLVGHYGKGPVSIRELAESGRAVIVISSDFSELVGLCTRVVALREGRVTGVLEQESISEEALVHLAYAADE